VDHFTAALKFCVTTGSFLKSPSPLPFNFTSEIPTARYTGNDGMNPGQPRRNTMNKEQRLTEHELLAMPEDSYMNAEQLAFFRQLLLDHRDEVSAHLDALRKDITTPPEQGDETDKASLEEEKALLLRQADRESKLLNKIYTALERIDNDDYGYCAETGEPIGLQRLLLRPTAELSMEAKQLQEEQESHFAKNRSLS
jgi:DnaK suppressor protein